MLKIGLEKEFFVKRDDQFILAPDGLPHDDNGLLAEARGQAFTSPVEAVFSLKADIYNLNQMAKELNVQLSDLPLALLSKELQIKAARKYQKGLIKYQNIYGHESHKNRGNEKTCGIHISFTNPQTIYYDNNKGSITYNSMFDWLQIFIQLDNAFKDEIKQAKRNPGFYELKSDGRIEYRSLPSNTDLDKIIEVLDKILKKN